MSSLEHDLGSCIAKGTSHGLEHTVRGIEMLGDTKISKDKSRIIGPGQVEEILGF